MIHTCEHLIIVCPYIECPNYGECGFVGWMEAAKWRVDDPFPNGDMDGLTISKDIPCYGQTDSETFIILEKIERSVIL